MPDREKVIKGLECCMSESLYYKCPYKSEDECENGKYYYSKAIEDAIALLREQEPITGETSDGYHTFNELYHHRAVLFSVIVANYPDRAWKSKKHHDGTMYDNMFIVGIDTPDGQATYHYDVDPYWDMFKCRVLDNAPEWDGHTPAQAIERIGKLKAQEPRVLTLDEAEEADICWLEVKGLNRIVPCRISFSDEETVLVYRLMSPTETFSTEDYGKRCRLWSAKPDGEQREAVKWDG